MGEPLRLESIAQIQQILGLPPPPNPDVAVIAASWQEPIQVPALILSGEPIVCGLYAMSLKRGDECHAEFGRQVHDGQAGVVVFLAPGQPVTPLGGQSELPSHDDDGEGWTVIVHPRLIAESALAEIMHEQHFFSYSAREALHLVAEEQRLLTSVVQRLEREAAVAPDPFTKEVIVAHLQLLFSYFRRAYARQFQTRAASEGVARRLDRHLHDHFADAACAARGIPSVQSCARALGYSPDYLSDLLRAETGESARDHIQRAVIEAAKARLLAPGATSSAVAYALGFEHPQHFARLFRGKTGQSPREWRASASGRAGQR
jgi:AraC family transcriptional activator of pobA